MCFLNYFQLAENQQRIFYGTGFDSSCLNSKSCTMKVMLPVKDDKTRKNEIAEGFHNIEHVCIYDTDLRRTEWFSAKEISKTNEGLTYGLIEKEVYSIISKNITPMVLTMFKRNGINVYKAEDYDVPKNLELFLSDGLKSFSTEESRLITACNGNSCSSCGTTCSN